MQSDGVKQAGVASDAFVPGTGALPGEWVEVCVCVRDREYVLFMLVLLTRGHQSQQ